MPLRLVVPLPGPFVYVSGGKRRRRPSDPLGPGFWAVAALALAALTYGVAQVWWIGLIVGVLALAVAAVFLVGPKGNRALIVKGLWRRIKADVAPLRR